MNRPLAIHQITVMDASPAELVAIAAAVGCQQVCVFTHIPAAAMPDGRKSSPFPLITRADAEEVKAALAKHGVGIGNIEFFPITPDLSVEIYREGLALGAELGAQRAVTHIHDTDDQRAIANLQALADMAAEYGLVLGIEFMGLTPACNSVERAAWFREQAGRPNIGIAVDALHLARTGGTPADVRAIPAEYICYAQICDGHGLFRSSDYLPEALDRALPGDGDFPLLELIEALPLAAALDVEVPCAQRAEGISGLDHAREAVARTRALIQKANVTR